MNIKNIIFDLGGVLLNIDFSKTAAAFAALGVKNFGDYFNQFHSDPLFRKLETGAVADDSFYDALRTTASVTATNDEINTAWNALLLDFPTGRIDKLQQLSKTHRLFLFSNTNAIHHAAFQQSFHEQFGFSFDSLFEKTYYSHLIGYRKPDLAAFEYVIKQSGVNAGQTLFIDDTLPNIEAAIAAGLQAAHLSPQKKLAELLDEAL